MVKKYRILEKTEYVFSVYANKRQVYYIQVQKFKWFTKKPYWVNFISEDRANYQDNVVTYNKKDAEHYLKLLRERENGNKD